MPNSVYALKIILFSKQLNVLHRELKGLKRVADIVSLIYVQFWHEATVSPWASNNDLDLIFYSF